MEQQDPVDGTSLFDTLFNTCFYEFGKQASLASTNVILLFSDGEDTASSLVIRPAIDKCRENHTIIYAFSPKPASGAISLGPSTLRQLTEQTGGRLFYVNGLDSDVQADMDLLGADLKDEYLLVFRPKALDHDGSFHRIVLIGSKRVATIVGSSGFYAPDR